MPIETQHGRRARRTRRSSTSSRAAGDCRTMFHRTQAVPQRSDARRRVRARRKLAQAKTCAKAAAQAASQAGVRMLHELAASTARELHDDLGQLIALSQMRLAQLALTPLSPQASRLVAQLQSLLAQSSTSLRRTCLALARDGSVAREAEPDMAAAIERHCRELAQSFEQRIEFHCEGERPALPASASAIVQRAARELLVNACKHAQAHRIDASIRCSAGELRLEVRDDGRGIAAQPPREDGCGFGLASIRRQLAALGAQLSIASHPGGGTLCRLRLPLQFPSNRHL